MPGFSHGRAFHSRLTRTTATELKSYFSLGDAGVEGWSSVTVEGSLRSLTTACFKLEQLLRLLTLILSSSSSAGASTSELPFTSAKEHPRFCRCTCFALVAWELKWKGISLYLGIGAASLSHLSSIILYSLMVGGAAAQILPGSSG